MRGQFGKALQTPKFRSWPLVKCVYQAPGGRRKRPPREERLSTGIISIRIARRLTPERLQELLQEHGTVEVDLADLAAAPNPASTKRDLYGPAKIVYILQPEGGIDTIYREA